MFGAKIQAFMKKSKNLVASKVKKPKPTYIYIKVSDSTTGGEVCEGQEGPYASREDEYREYRYEYASKAKPEGTYSYGWDSLEVSPDILSADKIFLAIVEYYNGGSFVRTYGNHYILGAFPTRKEAEDVLEEATKEDSDNYKPWAGYFEGLTDKLVIKLDLAD